jgi:hypothetical protein
LCYSAPDSISPDGQVVECRRWLTFIAGDSTHEDSSFVPATRIVGRHYKETWRSKAGGVCQVPQYMLLSDEIGPWAGDITKAKLPDRFLVDYVRVYDLVDAE